LANICIGEWEHKAIEGIKSVIPESVSTTWHEWRESAKKVEHDITGSEDISDGVEMAGWGVEEAEKQNKAEASKCLYYQHAEQSSSKNIPRIIHDTLFISILRQPLTLLPQVLQHNLHSPTQSTNLSFLSASQSP